VDVIRVTPEQRITKAYRKHMTAMMPLKICKKKDEDSKTLILL